MTFIKNKGLIGAKYFAIIVNSILEHSNCKIPYYLTFADTCVKKPLA